MTKKNGVQEQFKRGAGILLPISSLPSSYGIGTLGEAAYKFVDALVESGQKYWQVLPVGPTSFGDSPYQSFSAFAGNPYFIDLDVLVEEKLIKVSDITEYQWGEKDDEIDYATIYNHRFNVLKIAYENSLHKEIKEYKDYCLNNQFWLEDYSLYMSLKMNFDNKEWLAWDRDISFREEQAVKKYTNLLADEIDFWKFCQFKFYEQWSKLKQYANKLYP